MNDDTPLTRAELQEYHRLLDEAYERTGLKRHTASIRQSIAACRQATERTAPQMGGFVPRGKQRMAAGVSKSTGNAQEKLEYGIERHEAALGR